ncbi:Hpt domain-containing protein [Pseudooceanicola sp. MF1-13]|uniref:Hpt domain-containing protein n=1 Tax=Pseudooceanicola sp. MF1-13 TaxID=3379095 RepID=UPI00389174DE
MSDQPTLIDWTKVQDLCEDVGRDGFDEVVELFLEEVETALQTIGMAEDLEAALHFVKGCALNIGFDHFTDLAAQGERLAARGLPDQVDLVALDHAYRITRDLFLSEVRDRIAA